jgi:hypothetical protein
MSVDAVGALRDGGDRLVTVPGAVVAGLFVLVGLLELPVKHTLSEHLWKRLLAIDEFRAAMADRYGEVVVPENQFAVAVGLEQTLLAIALLFVVVAGLRVVGIRAFASPATDSFPTGAIRSGYFRAAGALLVFDVVLLAFTGILLLGPGAATWAGGGTLAMLVLPAYLIVAVVLIALTVLLYFARQAIALDGAGPLAALRESYERCRSNLAPIVALLVAVFAASIVGALAVGILLPNDHVAPIVSVVYQRIVAVYGIAVATQAYLQTQ